MKTRFSVKNTASLMFLAIAASLWACLILAACVSQAPPENPAVVPAVPVVPERPQPPKNIMGKGLVNKEALGSFLLKSNRFMDMTEAVLLAGIYIEESAAEGVNHDVAFSQMCLETGFLRFGGLVTPDMNNFCGLGAIGPGQEGHYFPSAEIGVRAHIQHLKGYATEEPLLKPLVDPRYRYVKLGSAPDIYGLTGRWAVDREYGVKIAAILERLYNFAFIN